MDLSGTTDSEEDIKTQNLDIVEQSSENAANTIRHIVISGGGPQGLSFYGFLRETNKSGMWNIKNIKAIYGTSIGGFIGALLCMNFEWDILDDFLIKRPWHTLLNTDIVTYLRIFEKKGMIPKTFYEDTMRPLFAAKDMPENITMKEFYEITGIEWHVYVTDLNKLSIEDISYKTHPDWAVTKALHCTCNLPIIFEPYIEDNKVYIDGGILVNYPINQCISNGANPDEILGLYKKTNTFDTLVDEKSSFINYIFGLLSRIFERTVSYTEGERPKIKHEFYVTNSAVNYDNLIFTFSSIEERQKLINVGVDLFESIKRDASDIPTLDADTNPG